MAKTANNAQKAKNASKAKNAQKRTKNAPKAKAAPKANSGARGTDWINLKLIERYHQVSSSQTANRTNAEYVFRVELDTPVFDRDEARMIRGLLLGNAAERRTGIDRLTSKREEFLLKLFIEMAFFDTAEAELPDVTDPRFALVEDLRRTQENSRAAAIVECGVALDVDDGKNNPNEKTTRNVRNKLDTSAKAAAQFVSPPQGPKKAAFDLIP